VLDGVNNKIYFYERRARFFMFCFCRVSVAINEHKLTERYKTVKTQRVVLSVLRTGIALAILIVGIVG